MNYPKFSASIESVDASLVATASKIRHCAKNLDLFAVEIGTLVDHEIRHGDGSYSAKALHELAKMSKVPLHKLGACHEAYLVERVAGVSAYLSGSISYDLYRQLARVLKAADASLSWKKDVILRVAAQVSRGLPSYKAGRVIDEMLAGYRAIETCNSPEPWAYTILARLAMQIDEFVAAKSVAA